MLPVQLYQECLAWMKNNQLACPIKSWTGFSCPGCGMQRSALAWMEGHWWASWQYHPGVWLGLALILIVTTRSLWPLRWRKYVVVYFFVGYIITMLARYMYLVANH
jgi:hypothetical protein